MSKRYPLRRCHAVPSESAGFTLIELIVLILVVAALVVAATILYPYRCRPGLSRRLVCASNIKGLGTCMKIYAYDNDQRWPMPGFDETAEHVKYTVAVGGGAGTPRSPDRSQPSLSGPGGAAELSVTRAMWMLVRSGDMTLKHFICPQSADEDDPTDHIEACYDFTGYATVSYGYQVPYGPPLTRAHEGADSRMVLAADKGPYKDANVATPPPSLALDAPPADWSPYNSLNHGGKGQNALFADGHVTFARTPIVGVDNDNIYTVTLDNARPASRAVGESPWVRSAPPFTPLDEEGKPMASTDSVIFP